MVLAGGGHAHLAVLAGWARRPLAGTSRTLITSARHTVYSGMVPGWVAGIYRREETLIDLAPLAERAGAELVICDVVGINPEGRTVRLANGDEIPFDVLSLAIGGEIRASAGMLPIRPMDTFLDRWSALLNSAPPGTPQNVAVTGGGAAGVELILAVDQALRNAGRRGEVALISAERELLAGHDAKVRALALDAMAKRDITIHFARADEEDGALVLSNGERLHFDCVIAATGSRAPEWLAQSGLACNADGFVAVGADLRSVSHPAIFAAGDIIDRVDRTLARSGVHAVKAGPVLAANLRAALSGGRLRTYQPSGRTLYLLSTADRRAIASWGSFATSGRLAWLVKDRIDRRFVARYA